MPSKKTLLLFLFAFCFLGSNVFAKTGLGLNLLVSSPQREFANVSGTGYGISAKLFGTPAKLMPSFLALRLDVSLVGYSVDENKNVIIPGTVFPADVTTSHWSIQFNFGPQITKEAGSFEFYFSPMVGFYYYATDETIEETKERENKWSVARFGWNIGGGMLIKFIEKDEPMTIWGFKIGETFGLDIGVKYHSIENVIQSEFRVRNRDANDLTFHLGVVAISK
jgi:hypothetical protein